ncbi:hypothetical protein [Aquimarina pacifica]|uniref:hypothetical protein n=1 Tax=Aquimarina pacifica TaxID=1296415 RepID=UPI001268AE3C|nr:hypothetical protein [Aquimarina pacifica]
MKLSRRPHFLRKLIVVIVFFLCSSCYSVRLVSTHGAPMTCQSGIDEECPDTMGNYYRDKRVIVLDTVIKSGIMIQDIGMRTQRLGCESGKLFSVEYKNTFGGALLYLVTFGNKRKVKIKYICMKPEN